MSNENSKEVIQLDNDGIFIGTTFADESPLEPGVFLIPANCVVADIPELKQNEYAKWNGSSFDILESIPTHLDEAVIPVELTQEEKNAITLKEYDSKLVRFFDIKASEKNYDNRITCSLRAGYPGPFQAEGLAFALWMDQCNAYCYEVIQDIQEGTRTIPTFEELSSEFPELVW